MKTNSRTKQFAYLGLEAASDGTDVGGEKPRHVWFVFTSPARRTDGKCLSTLSTVRGGENAEAERTRLSIMVSA